MSELGRILKDKRKELNLSLDELQEKTKIRKRYIEAIENGEYKVLPGHFYARAFIKSYAEALGMNAEALLNQYQQEIPDIPKTPITPEANTRRKNIKTKSPRVGKWVSRLVFYSFIILVGFFVWYAAINYFQTDNDYVTDPNQDGIGGDGIITAPPEEEPDEANEEPIEEPVVEEPEPFEPTIELLEQQGNRITYTYQHDEEQIEVRVVAVTGDVWMALYATDHNNTSTTITGNKMLYRERDPEVTFEVTEYQQLHFHFGNTYHAQIFINDMLIEDLHRGDSVHVYIQLDRVTQDE